MIGRVAFGLAALLLAAALALTGAAASGGADALPLAVDGDGMDLAGSARGDVARVVAVLADGTAVELALDAGRRFAYRTESAEQAARALRAEAADHGVLSTVRLDSPGCGGAAGPCALRTIAAATGAGSFALRIGRATTTLVEVDPRTLQPLAGRSLALEGERFLAARSPGGSLLAVPALRSARVDLVDLVGLERIGMLDLGAGGLTEIRHLAWVSDARLLAVVQRMSAPYRREVVARSLVVVDATSRRVVAQRPLPTNAAVSGAGVGGERLVVLLRSSARRSAAAVLVVADGRGSVRTVDLDLGSTRTLGTALAVEPSGRRAFVFPWTLPEPQQRALEIDLATSRSSWQRIRLARGTRLSPAFVGSLQAVQAGDRHVAVTGVVPLRRDRLAGGLFLVDTQTWIARVLDPRAHRFAVHGDTLFTFGPGSTGGTGIAAYALDGRPLYRAYGTRMFQSVLVAGGYGHALAPSGRRRAVFDPETGRGIATLPPLPRTLQLVPEPARKAARGQAATDPFATISNEGTPVAVGAETRRVLGRLGLPRVRTVYLLATRDGRSFYRLGVDRRGSTCFAIGRTGEPRLVGSASCTAGFPSRVAPVLDFTPIQLTRNGVVRLLRADGFAADAIATVELVDGAGGVVATVPVEGNVYSIPVPPAGSVALVARTASGEVALRRPYAPPPRPTPTHKQVEGYGVRLTYPVTWRGVVYRPRRNAAAGPLLLVSNQPLGPFRRIDDHAATVRRLPADGLLVLLSEAGAGSRASFPPARLPIVIPRSAIRDAGAIDPDGAVAFRNLSVRGRLLQVIVNFGSRPVSAATLQAVNGVLRTLRVAVVPRPAGAPLQHGEANGVTVDVYRSGLVLFRFASTTSRAFRLVAGLNVGAGCLRIRTVRGPWSTNGVDVLKPAARELAVTLGPHGPAPPYDACTISSSHGRRWNDVRGNHAAVEIAFTDRARRFFAERAIARDLALFIRSRKLIAARRTLRRGDAARQASAIVRGLPSRVVALGSRGRSLSPGQIGVWSDGAEMLEISESTPAGRRLFVTVRAGKIARHNLKGLAFVF